ncbi:hypothetical protein AB0D12_35245 [Streptomyces sp. NPDC048479]|uniref:hypothetical protein n=1 Tax=Streptomyces sp. NPDC048479 TaxID=3154725 RepID=UPI00343619E0
MPGADAAGAAGPALVTNGVFVAGQECGRQRRIRRSATAAGSAGPAELEAEFDALEASMPFYCEHVVPQSWFTKQEPMRGDLHHLFACEAVGFQPEEGKGTVARAPLYFLLRHPGAGR